MWQGMESKVWFRNSFLMNQTAKMPAMKLKKPYVVIAKAHPIKHAKFLLSTTYVERIFQNLKSSLDRNHVKLKLKRHPKRQKLQQLGHIEV